MELINMKQQMKRENTVKLEIAADKNSDIL